VLDDEFDFSWSLIRSSAWPHGLRPLCQEATLLVGSASNQPVQVTGFGRFFRVDEIHIENSVGVVVGNQCSLLSEDHYHVYQATIEFGPLLDPGEALLDAMHAMAREPDDDRATRMFLEVLRRESSPPPPEVHGIEQDRATPGCSVSVVDSRGLQIGDGNTMNIQHRYVLEQVNLPLLELMSHREVVRQFAQVLHNPNNSTVMADFLHAATKASASIDHEKLLAWAGPHGQSAAILRSFFGCAHVYSAEPVMLGVDNELRRTADVTLPGFRQRDLASSLKIVHGYAVPEPLEPDPSRHLLTGIDAAMAYGDEAFETGRLPEYLVPPIGIDAEDPPVPGPDLPDDEPGRDPNEPTDPGRSFDRW
jgi:hypothetical protein